MKKLKRVAALLLTVCVALSVFGCNTEEAETEPQSTDGYHFNWMDSGLFENVDKMGKVNLKDDYAAAVNYDWAKDQVESQDYSISTFGESYKAVVTKMRAMINDGSYQNKNIELVRKLDGLFNDWEYRRTQGVEPLKKYLGYIDGIKSLDDVSSYMLDNEKNPFATMLVSISHAKNEAADGYRVLMVKKPNLSLGKTSYYVCIDDDGFKKRDMVESQVRYILNRCGYSEKEINALIRGNYRFESELVHRLGGLRVPPI